MKKHILLAVALVSGLMLKAGDLTINGHGGGSSDSKFTVGICVGAALPMGNFGTAQKDSTLNSTTVQHYGFAETGFHFDVSASYMFAGPIGAMVMIGGNMLSVNTSKYQSLTFPNGGATITAKSYYVGQYLVGPALSLPAGSALKINIHVLVGLVAANFPTVTETATVGSGTETISGPNESGFGYNFGAGIKYNFNDKMGLLIDISYMGTASVVDYTPVTYASSFNYTDKSNYNMSLSMLTASVGLAFNL